MPSSGPIWERTGTQPRLTGVRLTVARSARPEWISTATRLLCDLHEDIWNAGIVPLPLHGAPYSDDGRRDRDALVAHRQRKIRSAMTKLTAPHAITIASGALSVASAAPSIITARNASFNAVSGSALTNGIMASGKRE